MPSTSQENPLISEYIAQLSTQERIVLKIASEHLETSFDIEKSIGYKNWFRTTVKEKL
uniref:Uncharacterized protein n=1 Tax=viral metagenome TaxID=1070528 RepID=A0A6C0BZU2_9ZZZZ